MQQPRASWMAIAGESCRRMAWMTLNMPEGKR